MEEALGYKVEVGSQSLLKAVSQLSSDRAHSPDEEGFWTLLVRIHWMTLKFLTHLWGQILLGYLFVQEQIMKASTFNIKNGQFSNSCTAQLCRPMCEEERKKGT